MLDLLRATHHNLLRNKLRTFLTILAIFIGSFTIILNVAINTGVDSFITDQIENLGGEDFILIASEDTLDSLSSTLTSSSEPVPYNPDQTLSALTDDQLAELKSIDGLIADSFTVTRNLSVEYISRPDDGQKYLITAQALPAGDFHISLSAGRLPDQSTDAYEITLQSGYPEALGFTSDEAALDQTVTLAVKDPVTDQITNFKATVVGVQAPGVIAVNGAAVSPALADAIYAENTKYYPPAQADAAYLIQARFDTSRFTEAEIKQALEDHGYTGLTVSDIMGMVRSFFDVIMVVFSIFGGIALLAAAIGIVNTLYMSVEERTREIGLDKALGMSSGRVFAEFALEAVLLGFWGSVAGVLISMLIGHAANLAVHAEGGFLEVFPTFNLFEFTPAGILPIILLIMFISLIAGTAPALKAAHKDPIEALRYE